MGRSVTQLRPRGPSSSLFDAGLARPRNPRRRRASAALGDDVASCRVGPQSDDLGPTTRCPGAHRLTACSPCDPVARDAPPTRGECAADRPAVPTGSTLASRAARRYAPIPTFSLKRKKHNCAVAPSNMGRWISGPHSRGPSSPLFGAGLARFRNLRRRWVSASPDDDVPPGNVAPSRSISTPRLEPHGPSGSQYARPEPRQSTVHSLHAGSAPLTSWRPRQGRPGRPAPPVGTRRFPPSP